MLLCLVLSLGAFSVGASAEYLEDYTIYQTYHYPKGVSKGYFTFYPNNTEVEKQEKVVTYGNALPTGDLYCGYLVRNKNRDTLFNSGRKATINFNNVYFSLLYEDWYNGELLKQEYVTRPNYVYAHISYTDGTSENNTQNVSLVVKDNKTINIKFEFTPSKDVQSITFYAVVTNLANTVNGGTTQSGHTYDITMYYGEYNGDDKYQFSFDVSSEEAGLLSGIIEWIKGIFNSIAELPQKIVDLFASLFDEVYSWLESVWNSIKELPQQIWSYIENGLKSLFVPDDDFIVQFKTDMDTMLSEKLGAVYQVTSLLTSGWDRITANDQQNTVNIPEVTIPLPDNNSFSFGGYNVAIVPNGFEFIVDILKTVIGIVCTILCVNALRKKYDEVMGVEQ